MPPAWIAHGLRRDRRDRIVQALITLVLGSLVLGVVWS